MESCNGKLQDELLARETLLHAHGSADLDRAVAAAATRDE